MSGRLTRLFTRNWPIKLAAVALALMLYVAVAAQQPVTQTFTLKLAVLAPPGRALLEAPPSVSVLLSGRGSEMLRLRSLRPVSLRVPDTLTASVWNFSLKPSDIDIPKGADVQVNDISPRDIAIRLDSVAGKDVRIVPLVRIVAESGYAMQGGLAITPNVARIVGSDRALAAIDSVMTVPTEIANVTGPFTRTVPIDTTPLGVVRIAPKEVTVSGDLSIIHERSFAGILVGGGRTASPPPELASLIILSQDIHKVFGGVVPELASRAHLAALPAVVERALAEAGVSWSAVDAVAVTQGPGLVGALLVGVVYGKALAYAGGRRLIGVNHLEGHLFAPAVEDPELAPPFVALLVSGGHTLLLDVPAWGRYRLLGQTRDDAAGEAFDKAATLLGLGYPGGAAIERPPPQGDPARFSFPRPLPGDGPEVPSPGLQTPGL